MFAAARDAIAGGLVRANVKPNTLTITGVFITSAAGVCYALAGESFAWNLRPWADANAYLLLAGALLILSAACDMLDGTVARMGGANTRLGAMLDSTLDRFSDFVVFAGIAVHYAHAGNLTFVLLAMLAFFWGFMISYIRARAENLVSQCKGGYWQRGERFAAVLIGTFAYNVPALVLQQAVLPMLTVARRLSEARALILDRPVVTDVRTQGWSYRIRLWRWPRMSWPYDIVTGLNIAWLIFAQIDPVDLLRRLG